MCFSLLFIWFHCCCWWRWRQRPQPMRFRRLEISVCAPLNMHHAMQSIPVDARPSQTEIKLNVFVSCSFYLSLSRSFARSAHSLNQDQAKKFDRDAEILMCDESSSWTLESPIHRRKLYEIQEEEKKNVPFSLAVAVAAVVVIVRMA